MLSKEAYLEQTEDAVRKMFQVVQEYRELFRSSLSPVAVLRYSNEEDFDEEYEKWRSSPEIEKKFAAAQLAKEELDGKLFSLHVVAGSILQIAYQAIAMYQDEQELEERYQNLLDGMRKVGNGAKKFFAGRDVRNVPLGLVVFAGRNQYNHLDAGSDLMVLNRNIFRALSHYEKEEYNYVNPAFDLQNDNLLSYSSNILSALEWDSFEQYQSDIKNLLNVA
ncbi:hypothetical protein GCM10011501_21080 [Thalassotalea profundi]|uniref:Uncharacterized protein n=2 Tax=Thalassotalea profundi TaxID=2036687 RepID=A0ABQ3IVS6_9GAMM|nr:hypothetical protein GCM10011501_21080 [Thalassotalea profundi]